MKLRTTSLAIAGLLLSTILVVSCRNGESVAANVFDSAPPDMKQAWDKAVAADQANDYVTAALGYRLLLQRTDQLQPDQLQAVEAASGKLFQRLVDASTTGDPAARRALNALGAMDRGRPVP